MLKSYFKSAYRQLLKNKLFSMVNITGLSIGMASIMALSVLIFQYVTTDSNQKDIEQMYYLKTSGADGSGYAVTPYPLLGEIIKHCPEVEAGTHIQQWYYPWLKYGNKEFQETTAFVDTGYFSVFQFPFKYGNPLTALQDKYSVVLSEEMAKKFFGNSDPVGKIVTADDTVQLTVTGVLQHVPTNSTVRPSILIPTALLESNADFKSGANWYNTFASNYLRLRKNSDLRVFDTKIAAITKLNYPPEEKGNKVHSVPYKQITQENAPLIGVIIKGALGAGFVILLIVFLNLINLNTAGLYTRTKEVAVKQMLGGSRRSIVLQFCIENGLVVFLSVLLAWFIFSLLLLPAVNEVAQDKFGEIETGIVKDYPLIMLFAGVGLLFTVLAASLPALKLAAVKVTDAVKGRLVSGNHKNDAIRNIFITIQFVFAVTLICVTIILHSQISYMKASPLGFNKENVGVANIDLSFKDKPAATARFESIIGELKNNPHVRAVSVNPNVPTQYWDNYNTFYDPLTNKEVNLKQAPADAGFVPVYEIPIIQGKNFDDALAASQKKGVLINHSAMDAYGWKDAVGKTIKSKGDNQPYTVIGVMEDFHYRDLQGSIEPLVQFYTGKISLQEGGKLSVRTDAGFTDQIMHQLAESFKTMPSRRDFSYELMADKVDKQYTLLNSILKVINYIALLTILIASMGMFGLISLFARMRVKEIGIRKVLGSSVAGIVQLLSKDFLLLVCLSIVFATPVAWYVMHRWLQDFAYRIDIGWWMFALGGFIALLIAFITLSYQSIKAATVNPVKSLKTE
ncbi:MAG TPA: ABC transporter permease [Puia sp.]|nr:ABC transporter permease [Puia sp.]